MKEIDKEGDTCAPCTNELIRQGVLMKKSGVVDIQNAPNSQPKKKKLNQRIQILHKFHLGSASCMCRNEEIYPFRLRNGPRIFFLAFHGDMPKKRKPRKRGFPGLYHCFKISSSSAAISVLRTNGQKIRSTGLLAALLGWLWVFPFRILPSWSVF